VESGGAAWSAVERGPKQGTEGGMRGSIGTGCQGPKRPRGDRGPFGQPFRSDRVPGGVAFFGVETVPR
jgi:hypothetical protein